MLEEEVELVCICKPWDCWNWGLDGGKVEPTDWLWGELWGPEYCEL